MRADHSANIADNNFLCATDLLDLLSYILCLLQAITVGNENGVVFAGQHGIFHFLYQHIQGSLSAADLGYIDQMTLMIHMKDRLDLKHRADQSGSGADTATTLEVHEIVHRKPMAQILLVILDPVINLFQAHAGIPLLAGIPCKQTLTHGGTKGIADLDGLLGILFAQLGGSDLSGLISGGKSGGESQHQYILTLCQHRLHSRSPLGGINSAGGGAFAFAQAVIHILQPLLGVSIDGLAPVGHSQGDNVQRKVGIVLLGKITAGVGYDLKCHR